MAVPSVTVIYPASGPSGGRQLLEVLGQGFQLAPAPPLTGKAPKPNPSVQVLFGGKPAREVLVVSSSRMFVQTPALDPVETATVFTADNTTDTLTATAHGLSNGARGLLVADADGALPAGLLPTRYVFVVNATAGTFQLAWEPNGAPIDFTDDGSGALTLYTYDALDVEVRNIDQAGALVPGETVTVPDAFTPLRPDLLQQAEFTRAVRYLIRELKRQVLRNVDISTNTDYDSSTGDGLNITELSAIPGLVLFGPQTRENRFYSTNQRRQLPSPQHGSSYHKRQRPPYTIDLVFTIVGVTDSKVQLLNLQSEVQRFFQRNKFLSVPCDDADPYGPSSDYEMDVEPGGALSVVNGTQPNNANIRAFSGIFVIRGFDLDDDDMAEGISRELVDQQAAGSVQQPSAVLLNPLTGEPEQLGVTYPVGASPGEDEGGC